jgi:hypothetical protein
LKDSLGVIATNNHPEVGCKSQKKTFVQHHALFWQVGTLKCRICYMVSTVRPVGGSGAVKSKGADNLVISDSFPM